MAKLSKKQIEFVKRNYDGKNIYQLSRKLNIPVREINKIVGKLKSSQQIIEKKYFPLALDKIYKFSIIDYAIFIGIFIVSLVVYVYTMTPGIAAGDCGELTCAVYFLGGAHSPGYPLYCVVGKLFMGLFFFIGQIVYRLTFLSAFGGALTTSVAYLVFIKLLGRTHYEGRDNLFFAKIPAIAASLFILFTEELWAQAVIAEVYTVNSLFLPIMFLIALVFEERVSKNAALVSLSQGGEKKFVWNRLIKCLYLFNFLFGLAMGDHHIIAGYFIPFILFFIYPYLKDKAFIKFIIATTVAYGFALISVVYYNLPEGFHIFAKGIIFLLAFYIIYMLLTQNITVLKGLFIAAAFLALGLFIYAYMPIRSKANAPLDWGNPEIFKNFINVISRKQYRGFAQNTRSLGVFFEQAYIIFKWRLDQFTPFIYFLFTGLGLYRLFKINKKWFYFTLSFLLYYDLAFMQFNNFRFTARDLYFAKVFFIPSYMISILWIVVGIEFFMKLIEKHIVREPFTENRKIGWLISLLVISLAYFPFKSNFKKNNVRHAWANTNYGGNLLKTLEYKSVLFTEGGDNQVFTLLYHTYVEHLRPDVNVYDQKGNVFLLYGDMMRMNPKQLKESQIVNDYKKLSTGRPVYYTWKDFRRQNDINKRYSENFEYRQMGILYKAIRRTEGFPPPIEYWMYYKFAWKKYPKEALNWDYLSREIIANYNFQLGDFYMAKAYTEYNNYQRTKNKKSYNEFTKYDKLAYDNYRTAQKYGFDMTAIHFNLSLLLEQKIRFLQRENRIDEILKILDEAIGNYKTAAVIENRQGNAARAYYTAGRAYEKKAYFDPKKEEEYYKEALEHYKKAIDVTPNYKDAKMGARRARAIINYPTAKLQQLEKNLKKTPKNEQLYFELVKAYINRLEANKAVPLLERASRYMPNNANVLFNLANLYQQLKRNQDAINVFKKLLKINPNQPAIYFYIGENYYFIKNYKEAYQHYKIFNRVGMNIKDRNIQKMMNAAQQKIRVLAPRFEK